MIVTAPTNSDKNESHRRTPLFANSGFRRTSLSNRHHTNTNNGNDTIIVESDTRIPESAASTAYVDSRVAGSGSSRSMYAKHKQIKLIAQAYRAVDASRCKNAS